MLKVTKFGGSSMADAGQYRKVKEIIMADPGRRVAVVSAAGKRFSGDHKLTDLLYLCHAHIQYGVSCDPVYEMITSRYLEIRDELGLKLDLESEFAALKARLDKKNVTQDELVSRGEYFSARLMADYLGFQFVDSVDWVKFNLDGSVDKKTSYAALRELADIAAGVVIPGFYGVMPMAASRPSPVAAVISPARWQRRLWMPTCMRTGQTFPVFLWPIPGSYRIPSRSPRLLMMSCAS